MAYLFGEKPNLSGFFPSVLSLSQDGLSNRLWEADNPSAGGFPLYLLPPPMHNLMDSLFADTEDVGECTQGFACTVTRPDVGITCVFFRCAFGHWMGRKQNFGV